MIVPELCPICGKGKYHGGHEEPGKPMKVGLRVFYRCGASFSIKSVVDGAFILLAKNCGIYNKETDSNGYKLEQE